MRKGLIVAAFVAMFATPALAGNTGNGCIGNCPTTNNNTYNTTNKGGTGVGIGVAKSNANASVRVSNKNVNVNKQGQAQGQKQRHSQRQGQEQGQSQSADNKGNKQTIEAAASSAIAPSINPSATCQVPVSVGGMSIVGGGSFGTTYTSEDCVQREDTRLFCELAQRRLADAGMCRALANDLPTVRAYKARQAEARKTSSSVSYAPVSATPAAFETE
jgi:hypothetical protein